GRWGNPATRSLPRATPIPQAVWQPTREIFRRRPLYQLPAKVGNKQVFRTRPERIRVPSRCRSHSSGKQESFSLPLDRSSERVAGLDRPEVAKADPVPWLAIAAVIVTLGI